MDKTKSKKFITAGCSFLIILWLYTAGSKLIDIPMYKRGLYGQPFSKAFKDFLFYALPLLELFLTALLCFKNTRFSGYLGSLLLLSLFTGYIILVLLGYYPKIPCSCGGILAVMSWKIHLWFNISCIGVCTGLILLANRK
jgi:hypothetical protein